MALSTSLVAIFNVTVLAIILRKNVGNFGGKRMVKSYGKILASSAIMGVVIYFLWRYLSGFTYNSLWSLILFLLLVIVVGAGIYISCTILFKMEEIKFVLGLFRRIKKS